MKCRRRAKSVLIYSPVIVNIPTVLITGAVWNWFAFSVLHRGNLHSYKQAKILQKAVVKGGIHKFFFIIVFSVLSITPYDLQKYTIWWECE